MRQPNQKILFTDIQDEWYAKLKQEGFDDIEDVQKKNRPLKEWHSFKLVSARFRVIREDRTEYQQKIEDFMNHPAFKEACQSINQHGNSKFTDIQIHDMWTLHCEGVTIRRIARNIGRSKSSVQVFIDKLREWMKIV